MMWWGHGFGMGGWLLGFLLMLLFWGGLIALVVWGIRTLSRSQTRRVDEPLAPPARANERALQIAQERYARGEITREEYEEIRQTLRA